MAYSWKSFFFHIFFIFYVLYKWLCERLWISFSLIKVLRNETFIFTSIHQNSVKQCSTQPSKEQECDWILCKGIIVFIYQFIIVPAKKKLNFKIKLLGLLLAKISSCTYTVRIFQFYQETFSSVIDFHELLLIYSAMT